MILACHKDAKTAERPAEGQLECCGLRLKIPDGLGAHICLKTAKRFSLRNLFGICDDLFELRSLALRGALELRTIESFLAIRTPGTQVKEFFWPKFSEDNVERNLFFQIFELSSWFFFIYHRLPFSSPIGEASYPVLRRQVTALATGYLLLTEQLDQKRYGSR